MPLPMFGPAPVTSATLPSSETFMPTAGLAPSVDDHGLDLHVLEDRVGAPGPPDPALLVAAERRPDHAARPERVARALPRLGRAGEPHGLADVAGPNGGHQAVAGAVGNLERLLLVLDAQDREHGSEDLLLGDAHVGAHLVEDRRLHEVAAVVAPPAELATADDDARALLAAAVQVTEHALLLPGADQRPHVDVLVPGADLHLLERRRQFRDDALANALVDHHARAGRAHLAAVERDAAHDRGNRLLEGRVRQHDLGGLAAQLETHGHHVLGARRHHPAAGLRRAGEAHVA